MRRKFAGRSGKQRRRRRLLVTAYTDASFSTKGGWAIWLRSGLGRIVRHGDCPDTVTDSFMAEMFAIKMALQVIVKEWPGGEVVLVNTDCLAAIDGLTPGAPNFRNAGLLALQEEIESFVFSNYLTMRFKHVKGHTGRDDIRSWLNRRVDQLSREARKQICKTETASWKQQPQ